MYGAMITTLTAEKWISHGLAALANHGYGALKADVLAKSLNVTRGSFYWHFRDVAEYHKAVIELWRTRATENIIAQIETVADRAERLPTLFRTALGGNIALDKAMRAWAQSEPVAKKALAEVEAIRVQYLEQLLDTANVPTKSIKSRARILHWAFVGYSNSPSIKAVELDAILEEAIGFALSNVELAQAG